MFVRQESKWQESKSCDALAFVSRIHPLLALADEWEMSVSPVHYAEEVYHHSEIQSRQLVMCSAIPGLKKWVYILVIIIIIVLEPGSGTHCIFLNIIRKCEVRSMTSTIQFHKRWKSVTKYQLMVLSNFEWITCSESLPSNRLGRLKHIPSALQGERSHQLAAVTSSVSRTERDVSKLRLCLVCFSGWMFTVKISLVSESLTAKLPITFSSTNTYPDRASWYALHLRLCFDYRLILICVNGQQP